MFGSVYWFVLAIMICIVWEAECKHLSQISNRVPNTMSSHRGKTHNNLQSGFPGGQAMRSNGVPSISMSLQSKGPSHIPGKFVNQKNNNLNINQNQNINRNNNYNSGPDYGQPNSFGSNPQKPISYSINELIHQQMITRRLLLNLVRQKLLDANGRYTTDTKARGANFMDPRPQPDFPNIDFSKPKGGSLIIESTGGISVTEVKTPNGRTEIVIDATSKNNKQTPRPIPTEEPPEVEKPAG